MATMIIVSTTKTLKLVTPLLMGVIVTMVAAFMAVQQQQHQRKYDRGSSRISPDARHRQKDFFSSLTSSLSSSSSDECVAVRRDRRRLLLPTTSHSLSPSSTNQIHLIILVHGWLGSPNELGYLQERLERSSSSVSTTTSKKTITVVHAAECNDGRTSDGIVAGGRRLANEIKTMVQELTDEYWQRRRHQQDESSSSSSNTNNKSKSRSKQVIDNTNTDGLHITVSLVGNSLGGLYARYAVKDIEWGRLETTTTASAAAIATTTTTTTITPGQFITTCTPHLGVSKHTYITVPRFAEEVIGRVLGRTGKDLFQIVDHDSDDHRGGGMGRTSIIHDMTTNDEFLIPLSKFQRRVALANAFGTDFQVPTSTAAFWEYENEYDDSSLHYEVTANHDDPRNIDHESVLSSSLPRSTPPPEVVMILQTPNRMGDVHGSSPTVDSNRRHDKHESSRTIRLSEQLNRLGWTKIVCDVRRHIIPGIASPWTNANHRIGTAEKSMADAAPKTFTAKELLSKFDTGYGRKFPLGHTIAVANSKDLLNRWITKGGRPLMDYLANDIISFFEETQRQHHDQDQQTDESQLESANFDVHINSKRKKNLMSGKNVRAEIVLMAKKDDNNEGEQQEPTTGIGRIMAPFTNSPGGMILFPFVFIFGLDLILNILALTKRSFEFFVLGQVPSTETW